MANDPDGTTLHAGDPSSEAYVPSRHGDGCVDFDAQNDPFGHSAVLVHPDEQAWLVSLMEYDPAGTSLHDDKPSDPAYVPDKHRSQESCFGDALNFPVGHS